MKELLLQAGWIVNYECACNGVPRAEMVKAELPGTIVKVYPKKGTWRASRGGRRIGEGVSSNLETFLNGLVA